MAIVGFPELLRPTLPFMIAQALDLRVVAFGACIYLAAGIMRRGWPVIRSVAYDPAQRGTTLTARGAVYRALVIVQVSLDTALAVGAIMLVQSFAVVMGQDAGFVIDRVLVEEV